MISERFVFEEFDLDFVENKTERAVISSISFCEKGNNRGFIDVTFGEEKDVIIQNKIIVQGIAVGQPAEKKNNQENKNDFLVLRHVLLY